MGRVLPLGSALAYFAFSIPFMLLTEETAWRGYALPRLEAKYRALPASLILGLIWGVWHAPLFLIPGSSQSNFPFLAFLLMATAQSILLAWLYNNTNGSVLIAALFHAALNAALAYTGRLAGGANTFWMVTAVTWAAVIGVVLIGGPAHLSRTNKVDQAPIAPPEYGIQERTRALGQR